MKSATLWEHLPKSCLLLCLVAAGVCAVLLIPSSDDSDTVRKRLIPRYQFEKEIRGPNYHVVHRVFDNDGYDSVVRTKAPYGEMVTHGKFQIRKRRAIQDAQNTGPEVSIEAMQLSQTQHEASPHT